MPYVCKRGRIYRTIASENEIPYLSLKELISFVEENEYRGFVSLPKGPYDTDLATHVSRSLEFIQKHGDLGRIRNIIIGDNDLSVRLRRHVVHNSRFNLNSDLKKVLETYKRKYYKAEKIL